MSKPLINQSIFFVLLFTFLSIASSGEAARNPFKPQLPLPPPEKPPEEIIPEKPPRPNDISGIDDPIAGQPPWGNPISPDIHPEPPVVVEAAPPEVITPPVLTVQGVIWRTDRPQAIINNNVVDIGDHVLDTQIVSIQKTNIEIEYQGVLFNITP